MILKGQILIPMCIRYKDKVTTATAAGLSCLFRRDGPDATNTFYNREQEREAKAHKRERRKETSHTQMLPALLGSPMANPESLKDRARNGCLICSQVGHWTKECPNYGKPPKQLATNAINWDTGRHSAPHSGNLLQPIHLLQITITGLESRV